MLKGFTVVTAYGNPSNATVSVTSKYFKFNADTAAELGNPEYVVFAVNAEEKRFAIFPCEKDTEGATPFHGEASEEKRSVINVTFKAAHAMIRKLMGWEDNVSRKMPGVYIAEENAIIFDLKKAEPIYKKKEE